VRFPAGVSHDNLASFFEGVDLYVDGLDFLPSARGRRRLRLRAARHSGHHGGAAGHGHGGAELPAGPHDVRDYFGWGDKPEMEKALRFLVGLAPAGCMAAIWSIRPAST
jgi:hypothetical protein